MSTFSVPTREEVTPANQVIFEDLKKSIGFVPNIFATLAYSKNGLGRYLAFDNGKTSLSNKEKEVIHLVVSSVNGCTYCQSAHTAIAKMNGFTEEQTIELRKGISTDPKFGALAELAGDIAKNNGKGSDEKVKSFFAVGYSNENLIDVILQVVSISATNYLHNITKVAIDFPLAPGIEAVA